MDSELLFDSIILLVFPFTMEKAMTLKAQQIQQIQRVESQNISDGECRAQGHNAD